MTAAIDLSHLDLTNKVEFGEQSSHGGYSDIFQGTYLADDGNTRQVAVKALRLRGSSGAAAKERLLRHFYREVLLWQRFQHPNITPLLGYMLPSNKPPALVSPWYIHGDVLSYLELHSDADRNALALDVLKGLEYLHSFPVAHGDLKAENVLVDGDKRASLCDFGMSQFLDEATQITGFTTTNALLGGTDRYLCPELLEDRPKTTATDIWALGCLLVQILADRIPYQHITRREAVLSAIVRGNPPSTNRPDAINPSQWDYISKCWNVEPDERPPVSKLWLCFQPKSSTAVEVTTGEENENTKYQVRARLYQLDTRGTYKERGTGVLKINVRKSDESGARIVMRTDGVYRLILNVLLFPGMHCSVGQDPRYLKLASIENGVPTHYAIRVSNAMVAQELYDNIESYIRVDIWDEGKAKKTLKAGEVEVTTGEENENTKYQVRARLYQLDTRGTFKERGTGVLKINVRKSDESRARIVMRTDGVYRLILNVLLFPGIHFRVGQDPRYIRLTSIEYGVPINYAIRVSNAKIAQELYDNIESCIPPRLGEEEEDVWMDEI